jgi:hypothetical protein
MTFFDLVGISGVFLCLLAYTMNMLQRMPTTGAVYPAINAVSSCMILTSLVADFNLAAALMEGSWLGVSMFGMVAALRQRVS